MQLEYQYNTHVLFVHYRSIVWVQYTFLFKENEPFNLVFTFNKTRLILEFLEFIQES